MFWFLTYLYWFVRCFSDWDYQIHEKLES